MTPTIADLVEHAVDLVPERVAIVCGDRRVTYAQLEERANRMAHHLAEHGVGPGAHVGFQCRNSIEALETIVAAYKLRSVAVNVNYRWVENELRYLYDNADLVALVHDRSFTDRVRAVLPSVPKLRHMIVIDDGEGPAVPEGLRLPTPPAPPAAIPHGVDYEEALAGSRPDRDFDARGGDDIYILYTGGTTGYPKGVMWRHEDVWRALGGGIDFYTGEPLADEWVQSRTGKDTPLVRTSLAPLIHGAAQWAAFGALFTCGTFVLMPRFDPHAAWRAVDEHKVNIMTLTGDAMARPLIEAYHAGDYDGSSLFAISSQAALFSPSVQRQFLDAFPDAVLTDVIGSSEGGFNGIQMITKDGVHAGGPRVKAGPDVIVIDDAGKPVAPGSGVIGKIGRAGPIPLGYYKDPEKTAALYVEVEGTRYVVPGDFARVEADGAVTLLGRANSCVNTGGEKVFPEEVEGALKSHPDVFDALVIGVPDERFGQRVAAVIAPRPGARLDPAALDSHVRTQIAGYKVPRTLWLVDEVGRLPSGKPDYGWAQRHASEHEPVPDVAGSAPVEGC